MWHSILSFTIPPPGLPPGLHHGEWPGGSPGGGMVNEKFEPHITDLSFMHQYFAMLKML